MSTQKSSIPKSFIQRRLHSLMGVWLAIFLLEHLLTNSQAALLFGDDGRGFINGVNLIHNLPYLQGIELFLLGVPFFIHIFWGVQYLRTSEQNSSSSDGSKPSLGEYPRNRAYTWQRITSWILLFAVIAHVVQMRFIKYPVKVAKGGESYYITKVSMDNGLYTVAERLGLEIYSSEKIERDLFLASGDYSPIDQRGISLDGVFAPANTTEYDENGERAAIFEQRSAENSAWSDALKSFQLDKKEVLIVSNDFAKSVLLTVRDTFKVPIMVALYSIFVIAAVFHAYNGLWTAAITWGFAMSERAQKVMMKVTLGLMFLTGFLGLAAVWGTYWVNLYH